MNRLARVTPVATVIGAAVALLSGQLGLVQMSVAEQVIVGLLALLAIDAFVERIGILRRIEASVLDAKAVPGLRPRSEIPRPDVIAKNASTIDVMAVAAVSIITQYRNFYRDRLEHGCRIRVLLLDPDSDALAVHSRQSHSPESVIRMHVRSTIAAIAPLLDSKMSGRGTIELRLGQLGSPFSLLGVDLEKKSGSVVVEFHTYRSDLDTRPHVVLDCEDQARWFGFFRSQFEAAWKDSQPISKEAVLTSTGLSTLTTSHDSV